MSTVTRDAVVHRTAQPNSDPGKIAQSFEELLLQLLDDWMERHPFAAGVLATTSAIALAVVLAMAVLGASI